MTRKWTALPLLLLLPLGLYAQSFWDGDASIQRGDAAFEAGNFAASNSFAEGTQVVIQDLDTGKSATVTVSSRISGQSNVLVMLSPKAAQDLGMQSGAIARVRVTLAGNTGASDNGTSEQTLSKDPDVNPAAAYAPSAEPQTPATDQTAAAPSGSNQTAAAPPASDQTNAAGAQSTTAAAPAAAANPLTDDQQIIADAEARTPQKDLYLPPREDQKFALQPAESGSAVAQAENPQQTPSGQQAGAAQPEATQGQPEIASVTPENPAPSGQPAGQGAGVAQEPTQPGVASVSPESAAAPGSPQAGPSSTSAQPQVQMPGQPEVTSVSSEAPTAPSTAPSGTEQLAEASPPAQSGAPAPVEVEGAPEPPAATAQGGELAVPRPLEEAAVPASPVQTEVSSAAASPPAGEGQRPSLVTPEAPQPTGTAAQTAQAAGTTPKPAASPVGPAVATVLPAEKPRSTTATKPPAAALTPKAGDRYFLQLAAFATEKAARDLEARFNTTYPILVVAPAASGPSTFRVLVGPLNRAESGVVLIWFRNRGFRDAFLRQE